MATYLSAMRSYMAVVPPAASWAIVLVPGVLGVLLVIAYGPGDPDPVLGRTYPAYVLACALLGWAWSALTFLAKVSR